MKISVAKREYLTEIEVRKFTLKMIKSYRNNLNLFLRFCEEEAGISEVEELTGRLHLRSGGTVKSYAQISLQTPAK